MHDDYRVVNTKNLGKYFKVPGVTSREQVISDEIHQKVFISVLTFTVIIIYAFDEIQISSK